MECDEYNRLHDRYGVIKRDNSLTIYPIWVATRVSYARPCIFTTGDELFYLILPANHIKKRPLLITNHQ